MPESSKPPLTKADVPEVLRKAEPFLRYPMSRFYFVRSVVLGVVLVPIRLFLFATSMLIAGLVFYIGHFTHSDVLAFGAMRFWGKFAVFCLGVIPELSADPAAPKPEELTNKSHVIVADHISFVEVLYLLSVYLPAFVGKFPLKKAPLIGDCMRYLDCIFVNRLVGKKSTPTTELLKAHVVSPEDLRPLLLFPEGTTSNGTGLITFHTGAFCLGKTVLPVAVWYPDFVRGQMFDPHWSYGSIITFVIGMMAQPYTRMHVHVMAPVTPKQGENPQDFSQRVRQLFGKEIGIPLVDVDYKDKVRLKRLVAAGLLRSSDVYGYARASLRSKKKTT
ncbi:Lysophosphatidylcholine acyltransferase 2 [Perkinsus olseni]|uniref:Lysophosphatidylcholine acyltransferase 2 n=1 Tax=Perkinsus olseni TaxID=32597 RepID=A0A7J6LG34_PEROL|nr:Lysophosphatidylcholine acyltransferase 2 [Perkinsus olseni]